MSFITKRERVFNEYDLFELPARNEGKLKAYSSCTDARAWSHFGADKTEHLVEIIKRNNEACRTKYVPTDVIVETLMVAKNAEIGRLKHKIEEFEQMLAAYDQLDLTCDQKCEIAAAHAAIKAANKELDELCLDLDLSGFTEGMDSDAFETGKSRGDEPRYRGDATSKGSDSAKSHGDEWTSTPKMESKSNQAEMSCRCDVSTSAHDPRIQELQETIISKDAKLSAMQNTIAVMENDVCEPYCIYAHIYTALEKIFGVLCQNNKYNLYLSLMTAGKDTRCIDIKGKILFKLKVLEKFSLALIAPCSQEMKESSEECACLRAEVIARLDFPSLTADGKKPTIDNKRAQLVADIMENDEMKELLSKDSVSDKHDDGTTEDGFGFDSYSIDTENLKRLKNLQENYDDLITCYENLKYEKESLQTRCHKYQELEKEFDDLKGQLREYNVLWTEREHYRKRSMDVDTLKEQYLILADETSNLETQLKAESEINNMKTHTIDELRSENIALEKKINDALISFEKEKNALQCKLRETECTVMCQDQQIKSLSLQIDRLLEQSPDKMGHHEDSSHSLVLIDEIESLKEQIKNLKDALFCSEEEKQQLQNEFQDKLKFVNELKMEIEDWKSTYEKTVQRNEYLEKYTHNVQDEVQRLIEENKNLAQDVEEKTIAVGNLINVLNNKSQEVRKLSEDIEQKENEQKMLYNQVEELREMYHRNISSVEEEKQKVLESLQLARQESQHLLEKVKDYNDVVSAKSGMSKSLESKTKDYEDIKKALKNTIDENESLQMDLISKENSNSILLQEIQRLREVNSYAMNNITDLQGQKNDYKTSLELTRKESQTLENKLLKFEELSRETETLKETCASLTLEKTKLENDLKNKKQELERALQSLKLCKKESEELIGKLDQAHIWETELMNLNRAHNELMNEKSDLQSELIEKRRNLDSLLQALNDKNEIFLKSTQKIASLENELINLKKAHDELLTEKNILQNDFDNKTEALNNLYNNLEIKIEENRELLEKLKGLEVSTNTNMIALHNENLTAHNTLNAIQKESAVLIDKLKHYESIESEYEKLKNEVRHQMALVKQLQENNQDLNSQNNNLQAINQDLENSLINTRTQLMDTSGVPTISYENVRKELDDMKKEKLRNHNKIKDLLNKLDEADNIISNLSEDILTRDDKISILENHINHLEDEIKRLQCNLADVIDTGESIKDNSFLQMDQSLKTMEAHHSKAAHNMKMELAKLQSDNSKLEQQLSVTKLRTEESARDKNKYLSQVVHLQNEREIIVTDIKQLELKSVGDSSLSPDQCKVEDVLVSLDRIRKSIEAKSSKSSCLEQTILKVQTSSQLLLTKADEAKRLVEKEKQKIIMEKEDAIRDRLNMEKRVEELKNKLDNQISNDARIIKDLEANILNQKLLNDHNISKLKDELRALQASYKKSTSEVNALQEKVTQLAMDNEKFLKMNVKLSADLEYENKERESLQNKLEDLCNKSVRDSGTQVSDSNNYNKNVSVQTEGTYVYDYKSSCPILRPDITDQNDSGGVKTNVETVPYVNIRKSSRQPETIPVTNLLPLQNPHTINEVQILTANIEPTFDFVRNSYLNYKMPRLSPGRLEQYSISNIDTPDNSSQITSKRDPNKVDINNDPNLIDIYNRSIDSVSSKVVENEVNNMNKLSPYGPTKSIDYTGLDFTNDSADSVANNHNRYQDTSFIDPVSTASADDEDLFVIYKDSDNNYKENKPLTTMDQAEMIADAVSSNNYLKKKRKESEQTKQQNNHRKEKKTYLPGSDLYLKEENDDDSIKPKLNINLPRVENDSHSIIATSEGDKKSLDSYTIGIYPSPKQNSFTDINLKREFELTNSRQGSPSLPTMSNDENQTIESYNSLKLNSDEEINFAPGQHKIYDRSQQAKKRIKISRSPTLRIVANKEDNESEKDGVSRHKLDRIGAEVYLIRSKSNLHNKDQRENNVTVIEQPRNFAMDYILDSVQREPSSSSPNTYNTDKELRKIKSDERFNTSQTFDFVPSGHSPLKVSSLEYKTISNPSHSYSKITDKTQSKSVVERSIMATTEDISEYESRIKYLTKALENAEKDYKKRLDAIKVQYDMNIKNILNEHNQGVKNIQGLHEETLQDIIKIHENEIENLRSMSIDANRRAEKLEKENRSLKSKIQDHSSTTGLDEEPTKISSDTKKRRRSRVDTKMLTKTNVEAFNVKPRIKSHGPCTCSLDANISDTIRNIFEQVDVDQRKMAEHTYVKYIANKILNGNVEALDAQELSFLHLKVCRTWKTKLTKEEALQKRIDSLESELIHKQRHAQQHIAELDRKVAEERRRLQEVREAVCRGTPITSRNNSPQKDPRHVTPPPAPPPTAAERECPCNCNAGVCKVELRERRSAGDLAPGASTGGLKQKRPRTESNRAVLAKMDAEERREKKLYNDEPPTRLRRCHDRSAFRCHKK